MPSAKEKAAVLDDGNALIEMYKAGFLDGYKVKKQVRSNKDYNILNGFYKKAFIKRFEKKINKEMKKLKKGKK
jgi:hypothetical protein